MTNRSESSRVVIWCLKQHLKRAKIIMHILPHQLVNNTLLIQNHAWNVEIGVYPWQKMHID